MIIPSCFSMFRPTQLKKPLKLAIRNDISHTGLGNEDRAVGKSNSILKGKRCERRLGGDLGVLG